MKVHASTTWNIERHGSEVAAALELLDLGFDGVMLRAREGVADAATCGAELRRRRVPVVAVHAPLVRSPEASRAMGALASTDEAERGRAVEVLLASTRHAKAAGCGHIDLHAGSVAVEGATDRFARWRERGVDAEVLAEVAEVREERARRRDAHIEAAIRALHTACRAEPDVVFAVETPLHPHGLPDFEELEILLSEVGARNLAYCHDTGHAAIGEALGGPPAGAWIDRYGPRLASAHLHDVAGLVDHLPPGAGTLDWPAILAALPSTCLRILEVAPDCPAPLLRDARRGLAP